MPVLMILCWIITREVTWLYNKLKCVQQSRHLPLFCSLLFLRASLQLPHSMLQTSGSRFWLNAIYEKEVFVTDWEQIGTVCPWNVVKQLYWHEWLHPAQEMSFLSCISTSEYEWIKEIYASHRGIKWCQLLLLGFLRIEKYKKEEKSFKKTRCLGFMFIWKKENINVGAMGTCHEGWWHPTQFLLKH